MYWLIAELSDGELPDGELRLLAAAVAGTAPERSSARDSAPSVVGRVIVFIA